jgi:radical SAM enzyme (rSAM/lipoprotein system)
MIDVASISLKRRIALDLYAVKRGIESRLHELKYLFWECTLRCNLACRHCGSDCQVDSSLPDMPLADFLRVLDGIRPHVKPNTTIIAMTGGEPLMRQDLADAGKEIYRRGFPWGMVTNGYAMSEAKFAQLLSSGLRSITVSLDGLDKVHDWFRGRDGSFSRAMRTIEMSAHARADGLVSDVVTCVHQRNIDSLPEIRNQLVSRGVRRWRVVTIFPKGRAANDPDLKLTPQQFETVFRFIADTKGLGRIDANYGCEGFLGGWEGYARKNLFSCQAGVSIGSVLADGSISACPSLRADYIQGNIYRDDFIDVWENRFQKMRNRGWAKTGQCKSCRVWRWCNGNGLHLRDEKNGELLFCHYNRLLEAQAERFRDPAHPA